MERFNTAIQGMVGTASMIGVSVTSVPWLIDKTSPTIAIGIIAVALTAGAIILIYSYAHDTEAHLNRIEMKLDSGFEESLDALDDADGTAYPTRTDGGGWKEIRGLDVEKMNFSGIPSVAGAGALGAIGAIFGPMGAAAGATIGALAGGGKEYQDLKKEHKERLETAAWAAVKRETQIPGYRLSLEQINDATRFTDDYWVFRFKAASSGESHLIRISKNDGHVEYKREIDSRRE